jgi:hypothetical protein
MINQHGPHALDKRWRYIGGIAQVTIEATDLLRMKAAHDPAQAISPITWAKRTPLTRLPLNNEISGRGGGS